MKASSSSSSSSSQQQQFTMKASSSSSQQQQQTVAATLPDDCWESIFRLIINDDSNICCYLNPLSLVSKQFLSVTDRLRSSLTVTDRLRSSLTVVYGPTDFDSLFKRSTPVYEPSIFSNIFKRFTNLNSLKLSSYCIDCNDLLQKISCFPLKHLTSLDLSYQRTIPTIGLRAFSQKITTLKSLICSTITYFNSTDLFLIAECFPLLEELDLTHPLVYENHASYVDGFEALSLALIKLRKVNLSEFPVNNESLFRLFNNCKNLEEVIMFRSREISFVGLACALREKKTLKSLSFSTTSKNPDCVRLLSTSHFIDSLMILKALTCLVLKFMDISDELLYSIARESLPLTKLGLNYCIGHSYAGIFCLLSKCQHVQHLDLESNKFLTDQRVVELSSFLGDLVSIDLSVCDRLSESALFALTRNCPSLSEIKMETHGSHFGRNCDSLAEFGVYPQIKSLYLGKNSWLIDEFIIMFASIFPNLQILDLYGCDCISEGICQVLKRCSKIRHLKLSRCPNVKLIGVNFVVPKLEVLKLSYTNVDDETLYVISKSCCGLLRLSLKRCNGVTEEGVKHIVENCTKLKRIQVRGIHISDKNKELFKHHGCNVF